MTTQSPTSPRTARAKPGALIVLACFFVQAVGVPNLAFARVIPRIVLPKRTVTVKRTVQDELRCENGGVSPESGLNGILSALNSGFEVGGSPALPITLRHNSKNTAETVWGFGWWTELDQSLELQSSGALLWRDGGGTQRTFFAVDQGPGVPPQYLSPVNTYSTLTAQEVNASNEPTAVLQREKDGTSILYRRLTGSNRLLPEGLTDRNGNSIIYTRDASGKLQRGEDIHGRYLTFTYHASGRVSAVNDSAGGSTTYAYDAQGDRTSETGPEGTIQYQYDAAHRITQITYPNGAKRTYTYDAKGRVTEEKDDLDNNKNTYAYHESSTVVTDILNRQTVYHFSGKSGLRRITKVVDAEGNELALQYDGSMNLIQETDVSGQVTRFQYDARGNITSIVDPSGRSTSINYEANFNRPVSVTNSGNTTALAYDQKGNLTRITDAASNSLDLAYDQRGHLTSTTDPLGKTTLLTYDQQGALASISDPLNRATVINRDSYFRITQITDPKGKITRFTYDPDGNLTQTQDAINGVTRYTHEAGREGRLIKTVTDAKNQTTAFTYDKQGRLTLVTTVLNKTKGFLYDLKGNLTQVTDAKGQALSFTYDAMDRMTTKTLPEGQVLYQYDAAGNLTKVTNYNGSIVEMTYDNLDRVIQAKQTLPGGFQAIISYTYDQNGNRTSMVTPWGTFAYEYDSLNRLTKITNPQSKVFTFTYDSVGRRTKLSYPNGIETNYSYDDASQLTRIEHKRTSDNQVIAFANYTYDSAGNRISMTDSAGTHTYGYDDLHRLTSATHPLLSQILTMNETFSYDAVGNRLADSNVMAYHYDAGNRLTEDSNHLYTADDNGNLTTKTAKATGQAQFALTHDSENRLVRANLIGGTEWVYRYDALGRTVEMSSGTLASQVTRYIYDRYNLLATVDGDNHPTAVLTLSPGIGTPWSLRRGDGTDFLYHADAMGSVTALSDITGAVAERVEYEAYGVPTFVSPDDPPQIAIQSSLGSPVSFTSLVYNSDVGFFNTVWRAYDPARGAFIAENPTGLAGGDVNLFTYAWDRPTMYADPMGLDGIYIDYSGYPVTVGNGTKLPLGHGAVIAVDPKTGLTRYFEYGRYYGSTFGYVRPREVPNLVMKDGKPTANSLSNLYDYISKHYGQNTPAKATYYSDADFQKIVDFALKRMRDKNRKPYSILFNNCFDFASEAIGAGRE